MTEHTIEVREPGSAPRVMSLEQPLIVGRDCDGLVCPDPELSRQHLELRPEDDHIVVEDLGSTNGTMVNGAPISGPTPLRAGDVIRAGNVDIAILSGAPPVESPATPTVPPTPPVAAPAPPPVAAVAPEPQTYRPPADLRAALRELESRDVEAAVIRFRPGTAGERAASSVGAAARRARRRLAGLGSEALGSRPQVCLVDPFPDPDRPGELITSGTIVDATCDEIWMIVTPESPPEALERPLAMLFGMGLPAGAELAILLEGWGLHVGNAPDPDRDLRHLALPPLAATEGELRSAMALSFVNFLVERGGEASFRRLLSESRPGKVDATALQLYGAGLAALEEAWMQKMARGTGADIKTGQFLRMALRYLRPHKWRELELFAWAILGMAFMTVTPFATKYLIDTALPRAARSASYTPILHVIEIMLAAAAVSIVANLRSAYVSAYVSSAIVRDIRLKMFERLQRLSAAWFAPRQTGDVMARIFNDVGQLESGLSQTLLTGITQGIQLIIGAVIVLKLNLRMGLITIATAPIVAVIYRVMASGAQRRSLVLMDEQGQAQNVANENLSGQAVVRAFALEGREIGRFRRVTESLFTKGLRLHLFVNVFGVGVTVVMLSLQTGIFAYGAWLIIHGQMTVGGLMAFSSTMGQVISPFTALSQISQQIQLSSGALVRINEVLDAEADIADAPGAGALAPVKQGIRLSNVSFSYTTERRTLEDLELAIPAGARVAFVGPTGAGKSSVLGLLMRNYDPEEGAVLFDGTDIRDVTVSSLRGQIGVVFQESFMFNATVRENIALGNPDATDADIEAAARAAELHDFLMTLPRGYDTLVGERGGRFSGGQRQRLSIARALVRNPTVLLLDEATSALDPRTERLIADTLDKVSQGRTTIAVTHRLTSITNYDRIFVLVDGRLVEAGSHDELVRRGGMYAVLWAEQTGAAPPAEASFDALAAVARIPLFSGMTAEELGDVASRLQTGELAPGQRLPESSGRLFILRRGRSRVLAPTLSDELAPLVDMGPGDVFGLGALLGQERGLLLEAVEHTSLLVLDQGALSDLAARYPSVGTTLTGGRQPSAAPAGGQRLSRMSIRIGAQ